MKSVSSSLRWFATLAVLSALFLSGCASVPMGSQESDAKAKTFTAPSPGKAGLYIFRNSFVGAALTKTLSVDGKPIGTSANKVYFYKEIPAGKHTIATQSEFSDNVLEITVEAGKTYFIRQYIKMGAFVGGANLELVSDEEGKKEVLQCSLAASPTAQAEPIAPQPTAMPPKVAVPPSPPPPATVVATKGLTGGQDGFQAARAAQGAQCHSNSLPIMIGKGPGSETYSVACPNGDTLAVRCEFGTCRVLK